MWPIAERRSRHSPPLPAHKQPSSKREPQVRPQLRAFLEHMPKGADLHMHLAGAVYAETFLKDAAQDKLCIDPVNHVFVKHVGTSSSFHLSGRRLARDHRVPGSKAL